MKSDKHLFSNIGIDSIGFYAPRFYLNLNDLAVIRNYYLLKTVKV